MLTRGIQLGVLSIVALASLAGSAEAFGRRSVVCCTTTTVCCYPTYCDPCHTHHHCYPWHQHCCYPCHYDPCCHSHPHPHQHCYCLAYKDPYSHKGSVFVRCDSCTGCTSGWHFCYVYLTGTYEWVKVYRCYQRGTYDKEAEQAEGFQKAGTEMTGPGVVAAALPEGAKVTINGTVMPDSKDTVRLFQTPDPIAAGEKALYEFVIEYVKDGRTVTSKHQVSVRASEEVQLRIDEPSTALAAK